MGSVQALLSTKPPKHTEREPNTSMKLYKLGFQSLLLGEHCYLDSTDECYFADVYECCQRQGLKSIIRQLKHRFQPAIAYLARELATTIPLEWRRDFTFVPMPPSSGAIDGIRLLVKQLGVTDVRSLLQHRTKTPTSSGGWRLSPRQRSALLVVDELIARPCPKAIVVVDDVLATGSHFRGAKVVLQQRWPGIRIIGLFLTRACSRHRRRCYRQMRVRNTPAKWGVVPCDQVVLGLHGRLDEAEPRLRAARADP